MNAYVASASRLGAALGRDGALPGWLARGGRAGQVPRASLAVVTVLTGVVLALLAAGWLQVHPLVLATTSCIAAVYAVGCAAGVRLLPPRSAGRRAAAVALLLVAGLLVLSGPFLAWPAALAAGALAARAAVRPAAAATGRARRAAPAPAAIPMALGRRPRRRPGCDG
jgi:amino acid efflux transporter